MSVDSFKLTYSTMFDPPEELHQRFEAALATAKSRLGGEYPLWIGGRGRKCAATFEVRLLRRAAALIEERVYEIGTTGKAIGSFYYLPQYLREQSQTVVE